MFEKLYLLRSFKEARDASLRALNLPGPSKGSCAVKAAGLGGLGQAALELVTLEHSANGMLKVFGQFFSGLASLSPAKRDAYLDCLLRPAEREDATLVKVIFDSGERIFLVPVHTPVGTAFLG